MSSLIKTCRACDAGLSQILDLGNQPPSNSYVKIKGSSEQRYPLQLVGCKNCGLLQLSVDVSPLELFHPEYQYFSSHSSTWLEHCENTIGVLKGTFDPRFVIEVASNDGYLLEILDRHGVKVLDGLGKGRLGRNQRAAPVAIHIDHNRLSVEGRS